MPPTISPAQRLFYAAVGLLAVWVGGWGYLAPTLVDSALPWLVPPMHARFLGAMYLSGTTFMLCALLARRWSSIRVVVPMISVWTGMLFIVSLFHLPQFDWSRSQVWVWFAAYFFYPVIAAWIAWRMRTNTERGGGPPLPSSLRLYLTVQGVVVTALALLMFLLPGLAVQVWPWAITPLLAQLYSAPFLSYGFGSLYAARQSAYADVRIVLIGTFVFALAVLLASYLHLPLFSTADFADWLWFLGFGVATLALGVWSIAPRIGRDEGIATPVREGSA